MTLRRKLLWVGLLYFAEGLPLGIAIDVLPVYFRVHGLSLEAVGFLSLLGLPWTLKVLWAPLVDRIGQRRHWIAAAAGSMALLLALLPLLPPAEPTLLLWVTLLAFTTLSATQDIAIDAWTIGVLDPGEEGPGNGVRVMAYRAALIAAGGGLVVLAGRERWPLAFGLGAALMATLAVAALRAPSDAATRASAAQPPHVFGPLAAWLARPAGVALVIFVVTFKMGDAALGPMAKPYWLDRGLSVEEIGLVSTTLGTLATVLGALAGGGLVRRWGIVPALWRLGALQALSNLGYAAVALSDIGREAIWAASLVESATGGLGTASFLAFLMSVCERERAATEYALLSALFGLGRTLAGTLSGLAAARFGYAAFFAATFLLALPAFALIPAVSGLLRQTGLGASAAPAGPPATGEKSS